MRIAVTSQNFRTVTPHAGRTRRFLIYRADPGETPMEVERLELPKHMAMHAFHGGGGHPLDSVDAVIAGSFGEGFARRMAKRGVRAVITSRTDPLEALRDFLAHPERWPNSDLECGRRHRHGRTPRARNPRSRMAGADAEAPRCGGALQAVGFGPQGGRGKSHHRRR